MTALAQQTSEEPAANTENSCPTGQVMIGGKCRILGKKAATPPPAAEAPSEESAQSTQDACPEGQVMIGGKCRTLGKKAATPPPAAEAPSEENAQSSEDACSTGQVMIGGKCRTLGKKAATPPPTHDTSADAPEQAPDGTRQEDGQQASSPLPVEPGYRAASWGGIVRAGPGRDFDKVASLIEGQPVEVLGRASEPENGYPWFKIRFGESQIGYQWGGIMCSRDVPRQGLFQTCNPGSDATQESTQDSQAPDDGLIWRFLQFNNPLERNAVNAQVVFGIPETDAIKVVGSCSSRSNRGSAQLDLSADIGRRENGAPVSIRMLGKQYDLTLDGTILQSESGEGLQGYHLVVAIDDPLWAMLTTDNSVQYGEEGIWMYDLPLKESRGPIGSFLNACRAFGSGSSN